MHKSVYLTEGKDQHIIKNEKIRFTCLNTNNLYPKYYRRVLVYSQAEKADVEEIIKNNFPLTALTIAELFKQRWSKVIFFSKECKGN